VIGRRAFVAIVAAALATRHGRALAQGPGKIPRVSYVGGTALPDPPTYGSSGRRNSSSWST
jgi:hypothetical protein